MREIGSTVGSAAVRPAPNGTAMEERPSVLAVTSELPWPLDSGGHLRTFHMLRAMARHFRVRLVAPRLVGQEEAVDALRQVGIAVRPAIVSARVWWLEGASAVAAAARSEPYVLYHRHNRRAVWTAIDDELARDRPDLLYLDHLDSTLFAKLGASTPRVIDLHNVYSTVVRRLAEEQGRPWSRWYLQREARLLERIEQRAVTLDETLLAVSEADRQHFVGLGARSVHLVPNGVDCAALETLPTAQRTGPPIILFLGTMSWAPNQTAARFLATDVLPRVRTHMPNARLRIVGRDPSPDVMKLARLPGVDVTGTVASIVPYLREAHVLAVPLESGGGTRLKILEAFAAGVPVVTTPVGCEGLNVTAGMHLLIENRQRFAEAIVELLNAPALAERLATNSRRLARECYDWTALGESACEAVERALRSTRPRTRSEPIRVLELRSVRGCGGGPEKTILLGAAKADRRRVAVTVCYIRDARDRVFAIDQRARQMDVDYVEILERHSFDPAVWPKLRSLIRQRRIDIVHAHDHKTNLLALLLGRAERVIPLATAHGWSGLSWRERMYYFFDRRLLAWYPLVIAVSDPIRRTILRYGADRTRVRRLLNGIDSADFTRNPATAARVRASLGIPADATVVGSIGRLEPVKRFDLLLEAAAKLRSTLNPYVVLVGDGSCRQELAALGEKLALGDRLLLLGHRADIHALHQLLDVYVQTSDSEGVPNVVLEAMALETPVVATHVGGTQEIIEHEVHGLLVPRRDPDALARAIECTLVDRKATARRVAAARSRIERDLSFDGRMAALEGIYEELMDAIQPRRR